MPEGGPGAPRAERSGSASALGLFPVERTAESPEEMCVSRGMGTWDQRKCLYDAQEKHGTIQEVLWGVFWWVVVLFVCFLRKHKEEGKEREFLAKCFLFYTEMQDPPDCLSAFQ